MKNKKCIIISILIIFAILIMTCFAISANAENTGGTAEQREDEKTLVRMASALSKAIDSDNKVNIDTLSDVFDKYIGEGVTTVTEQSSEIIAITFVATGNVYEINVNTGAEYENTEYTTPYLPTGFSEVAVASSTTGYTIQDGSGNQYVWVEVPQTTTVYPTAGLAITEFTDEEYDLIEADLQTYTSTYRNSTSYTDTWYSEDAAGLTETEYYTLKDKMLKSVYQNGGFYVGKYETGTATARTSSSDTLTTAVSQADAYAYNYVTNSQAQTLASGMESGEYTSSLMFGVQWDLVMKYLETKGATEAELNSDSISWGNYYNNLWSVASTTAKYSTDYGATYTATPYEKTANASVLLTTGADSSFSKMGIYDIAGNVGEWTLEYTSDSSNPCARRGGYYGNNGNNYPASYRYRSSATGAGDGTGFRVALY